MYKKCLSLKEAQTIDYQFTINFNRQVVGFKKNIQEVDLLKIQSLLMGSRFNWY